MHEATPGECTLCDRSCRYFIQNDFFCRLAGPVAPTGKAIVHWIGCINAIKLSVSPGSDSTDALVSSFCDNSPQSVYKLAKSRSRANTGGPVRSAAKVSGFMPALRCDKVCIPSGECRVGHRHENKIGEMFKGLGHSLGDTRVKNQKEL